MMPNSSETTYERPARFARNKLIPHRRCRCGLCRECLDNAKWDRVFAKFEVKVYWDERGVFQSTLGRL
jgi:hypothetical protein